MDQQPTSATQSPRWVAAKPCIDARRQASKEPLIVSEHFIVAIVCLPQETRSYAVLPASAKEIPHFIRLSKIPDAQKPPTHPRFHAMTGIACRRLLSLRQQDLLMANEN
jgi:hypothetical protein